jgi:hypothetical protein
MSRPVAVESPIMPPHLIDADEIVGVNWNDYCFPAVRILFRDRNFDVVTRKCAIALVALGAIPGPN